MGVGADRDGLASHSQLTGGAVGSSASAIVERGHFVGGGVGVGVGGDGGGVFSVSGGRSAVVGVDGDDPVSHTILGQPEVLSIPPPVPMLLW